MSYYDYLCDLDQEYRELQGQLAQEWQILGETDGDEGIDPEYPNNAAYLHGYDAGRARYIRRLADFKKLHNGRLCRCGLVRAQDCECDSQPEYEDEF